MNNVGIFQLQLYTAKSQYWLHKAYFNYIKGAQCTSKQPEIQDHSVKVYRKKGMKITLTIVNPTLSLQWFYKHFF